MAGDFFLPLDIMVPMCCRYPIVEYKLPQNVLNQSICEDIEFTGERKKVGGLREIL